MSLLPPVIPSAAPLQARDMSALAVTAAQRATPAISATQTQAAVQQAKAVTRTELLSTRDLVPVTDKRNRLVGPPPTFDVNLLQHIRETRNDPPEVAASLEPQGADPDGAVRAIADKNGAADTVSTAYGQLLQSGASANPADRMNARL